MFPPVSKDQRRSVAIAVTTIGALAAASVYLFQTEKIALGTGVAGILAAVLALGQWALSQAQEAAKVRWEAVRAYYEQRDDGVLLEVSHEVFSGNLTRANLYCNFFEKWARLVQMGYLPLEVFDGPTGVHIANALLRLEDFIVERRTKNALYASSYLWLVKSAVRKPEIQNQIAHDEVERVLRKLNAA